MILSLLEIVSEFSNYYINKSVNHLIWHPIQRKYRLNDLGMDFFFIPCALSGRKKCLLYHLRAFQEG